MKQSRGNCQVQPQLAGSLTLSAMLLMERAVVMRAAKVSRWEFACMHQGMIWFAKCLAVCRRFMQQLHPTMQDDNTAGKTLGYVL
jgi:hypothetical protein